MNPPSPAKGPPQKVVLEGRYCRLEPIAAKHGDDLFAAAEDERFRYLFNLPPSSAAEMRERADAQSKVADPMAFAVIDRQSGKAEGQQSLMNIVVANGTIEVGSIYWGPAMARTRKATEALYLHARYIFDELGYRRFEWKCNDRNAPSKAAALRFGFVFEGVFRQHMIVKGENRDTAWFAMLDGDWPRLKAEYERWLEPGNFGPDGTQRTRLLAHR